MLTMATLTQLEEKLKYNPQAKDIFISELNEISNVLINKDFYNKNSRPSEKQTLEALAAAKDVINILAGRYRK